jgi:hypothetical protein
VGLLEPHAGHSCGARQREVSCTAAALDLIQAQHMKNRSSERFFFVRGFSRASKVAKP